MVKCNGAKVENVWPYAIEIFSWRYLWPTLHKCFPFVDWKTRLEYVYIYVPPFSKDGDIPFIAVLKRNNYCRAAKSGIQKGAKGGYSVKLDIVLET